MAKLGVNVGNDIPDLTNFETWLARAVDFVNLHGADKDYSGTGDHRGQLYKSLEWLGNRWKDVPRTKHWTPKLNYNVGGSGARNLSHCADGQMDDVYRKQCEAILKYSRPGERIIIRPGAEFNGSWFYSYSTFYGGGDPAFIATWRHFAAVAKDVIPDCELEWCSSIGSDQASVRHPMGAYPGDDVVDLFGLDFYYHKAWLPADPVAAFEKNRDRPWGLAEFRAEAKRHGKREVYSEWGIETSTAGPYIELCAKWFADPNCDIQAYWQSDGGFQGKIANGRYGAASETFRTIFKVIQREPAPAPAPAPATVAVNYCNAADDTLIAAITDGATVPPHRYATIVAEPSAGVASVKMTLAGGVLGTVSRTESFAPYALFGDSGGDLLGAEFAEGAYSLAVELMDAAGTKIGSTSLTFAVKAPVADDPGERIAALEAEVFALSEDRDRLAALLAERDALLARIVVLASGDA